MKYERNFAASNYFPKIMHLNKDFGYFFKYVFVKHPVSRNMKVGLVLIRNIIVFSCDHANSFLL